MHKISTALVLEDIRSGLGDPALMTKHGLSRKNFQRLLLRLVDEKVVGHEDLYRWSPMYRYISDVFVARRYQRIYVPLAIRVFHNDSSQKGFIRDISEIGLRVAGIEAEIGESILLTVPLTEILDIGPFNLRVACRWSTKKGNRRRFSVSGFEIVALSADDRRHFAQFLAYLQTNTQNTDEKFDLDLSLQDAASDLMLDSDPAPAFRRFSGTLDGVDILDIMQFMHWSRQKLVVEIRSYDGGQCRVYVMDGNIIHAASNGLEGVDAFFLCMAFAGGQFATHVWQDPGKCTISSPTDFLIMEAARRRDEGTPEEIEETPE